MNFSGWLLLLTLVLAWYCVGIIWLVQVVAWPLFAYVGRAEFDRYHQAWWRGIRYVILVPSGLAFLGGILLLADPPSGVPVSLLWAAIIVDGAMWVLTAAWFGPQQAKLTDTGSPRFQTLIHTHWLRTALVSGYGVLLFAALFLHLT